MQDLIPFIVKYWYLFAAIAAIIIMLIKSETQSTVAGLPSLLPEEVVAKMNHEDALVVDVRDHNAFANGHILGAHHIMPIDLVEKKSKLPKQFERPLILVDSQGQLLPKMAAGLKEVGFQHLFVLKGGMRSWTEAGLPLAKKH